MSGFLELKCSVIKGGMKMLPVVGPSPLSVNPIFEIGPLEPRYSEWLVFEGVSVDEKGRQHYLDATIAYKRAVLNCIKYLSQFGYTEEQVYLLLSCIPVSIITASSCFAFVCLCLKRRAFSILSLIHSTISFFFLVLVFISVKVGLVVSSMFRTLVLH